MATAKWQGKVLAKSDNTIEVEGNQYFPPESINCEYFKNSDTKTDCAWKGEASYYNLVADGDKNPDGAWYYPDPKEAALPIKGFVAFGKGVEVN